MFYYDPSQPDNQASQVAAPGTVPSTPTTQEIPQVPQSTNPIPSYTRPEHYMQPVQPAPYAPPSAQSAGQSGPYSYPVQQPAPTPAHYAGQYPQTPYGYPTQHAHTGQPGLITPQPARQPAQPARQGSGLRSAAIFLLTCLVILMFGAGLFSGWVVASTHQASSTTSATATNSGSSSSNATMAESQQEAVIAKVEPSVVEIEGVTSQGEAIGSGIIIDSQGDIVTNNHVVDGTTQLQVVLDNGNNETAQIIGTNAADDLAVVRIQPFTGMAVATLGDSSKLSVGEEVLAIGNPLGLAETATEGVVSALNRTVSESNTITLNGLIQTSAAINPGNSGGALVNLQGQVIGMPTLAAVDTETNTPANGLGFAIASNQIKTVVAQILNS